MIQVDGGTIVVGILAFLGVVLAPYIASAGERRQERQKARHDYISSIVAALVDLRGELQYYQLVEWNLMKKEGKSRSEIVKTEEFKASQIAYGKAYAIMISVDIPEIREKASIVMGDVMKDVVPSEKLDAIDFALRRLGKEYGFFKLEENDGMMEPNNLQHY